MRWYHPRLWHGMDLGSWLGLLIRNRFQVSLSRTPMAIVVTVVAIGNSIGRFLQYLLFGRALRAVVIDEDPIFIIGHWRSGTTMLHETLALDCRHKCPGTYECLAPHHGILTKSLMHRWGKWLLPSTRPMDSMAMGWERPQEDELALCAMGLPSIYMSLAFPSNAVQGTESLDFESAQSEDLAIWKAALLRFARQMTFRDGRRLVLKSPSHTSRLEVLLQIFPDARFVHLVRDPHDSFCSTLKMWRKLGSSHSLQRVGEPPDLEDRVFDTGDKLLRSFKKSRHLVAAERICTIRFEDLIANPVLEVQRIYSDLRLEGFETFVRPQLENHLKELGEWKVEQYRMDPKLRTRITDRWGPIFSEYGYGPNFRASALDLQSQFAEADR